MQPIKLVMSLGLALSAGCLSLSTVPQEEVDADADTAMSEPDAEVQEPYPGDAGYSPEDASRDATAQPIVDARVMTDARTLEDARVVPVEAGPDARADASVGCGPCDGTCRDGACLPAPLLECTPGVRKNCLVKQPFGDWLAAAFQLHGEFLYWIERGTTDAFNNPKNDGALARMRIGEWKREVLLDSLDFFDEGQRKFVGVSLWVGGDTAVWWVTPNVRSFLSGIERGPRVRGELMPGVPWCLSAEAAYYVGGYEPGRSINPIFIDRYDGSGRQQVGSVPRNAASCAVVGGYLYGSLVPADGSGWRVALSELGTPEAPRRADGQPAPYFDFTSSDWLSGYDGGAKLWSNGPSLFTVLADGRIGVAPNVANFDASSFRAITESALFVEADQEHVYWSPPSPSPWGQMTLFRVRLDGSSQYEVSAHNWYTRGPRVNEHAVVWWREDIATFEIAYFPPSAGAQ